MFLVIILKFFHSSVSAAEAETAGCVILGRIPWVRNGEGTLAMSGKTSLVSLLSGCPAALFKQMYGIFALYCCFIAQYLKWTSLILCERVYLTKRSHIAFNREDC